MGSAVQCWKVIGGLDQMDVMSESSGVGLRTTGRKYIVMIEYR